MTTLHANTPRDALLRLENMVMMAGFEMPVVAAFLSMFGLVTARFLWKKFNYALVAIVLLAAIISPTGDALNLFWWSAPMVVLYIISIGVAAVFGWRRRRKGLV